ncbi:2-keto-4-pentenoate hydratase [Microbacterium pumilum]|uniref:Fumarylacetoacetate hydrolase family protein n=1 Tax=Microbacterium pumilum TaxID=344165 RepID=A0ABP5EJW0_9MICO
METILNDPQTIPANARELQAARALLDAGRTASAIDPVRDVIPDIAGAYRVQELVLSRKESANNRRTGRKVGLTSIAVQTQLGVDQPDFGVLLEDMHVADGGEIDLAKLIAPKIEAEVAFVLKSDVLGTELSDVVAAVDYAVAALEIVDSRVRNWDITIVDTIADNASSAQYVLGERRLTLDEFVPRDVSMTLHVNGTGASEGKGIACLGDPLNALLWVARTAAAIGQPLRAGEVVLSGALGPMVPLNSGDNISASIGPLGVVSATCGMEK